MASNYQPRESSDYNLPKEGFLKRISGFSGPQLVVFIMAFGLIGYFLFKSFASEPLVASLEAEQMGLPKGGMIIFDKDTSGGKAIQLTSPGSVTGSVNFSTEVTSLSVAAKATVCSGAPTMSVTVDGQAVLSNTKVGSSAWTSYSATPAASIPAGLHNLSIAFNNDHQTANQNQASGSNCSKLLYLDVSHFYGPKPPPTPTPTITLNASPKTVTAGHAATLIWNTTNADNCQASGSWSGSQPTSGSVSTGGLNQKSGYKLVCSGAGGSAATEVTVTVAPNTSNTNSSY